MNEAKIGQPGWFLGECACCHGSFLYTLQSHAPKKDNHAAAKEIKSRHVGRCPLCGAEISTPWR